MNILIISNSIPYPPSDGDKIRNFELIKRLGREHKIGLVGFVNSDHDIKNAGPLKEFCDFVEPVVFEEDYKSLLKRAKRAFAYLVRGEPLYNRWTWSADMAKKITEIVNKRHFDIIQFEHSYMASYIYSLNGKKSAAVLTLHNIEALKFKTMFKIEPFSLDKLRFFLNALMYKNWEPKIADKFVQSVTMSDDDAQALKRKMPGLRIQAIPNGVDTKSIRPLSLNKDSKTLLFVGKMTYQPNRDAAIYFCRRILPLIKKRVSGVKVLLVGNNSSPEISDLASFDIEVLGLLPRQDLARYYEDSAMTIVPLRAGSGTRFKILESMAYKRPVVSTSIGCEGLGVRNRQNILIADKPQDFAGAVIELLSDPGLREEISENACRLVRQKYDWDVIAENLITLYRGIIKQ
ncbi:MAG: glycosyltransferase [Candidatus Omnitrophica bacterium]|nr:glycosyltransferase [Candidatus Omnitrophota bacterium]